MKKNMTFNVNQFYGAFERIKPSHPLICSLSTSVYEGVLDGSRTIYSQQKAFQEKFSKKLLNKRPWTTFVPKRQHSDSSIFNGPATPSSDSTPNNKAIRKEKEKSNSDYMDGKKGLNRKTTLQKLRHSDCCIIKSQNFVFPTQKPQGSTPVHSDQVNTTSQPAKATTWKESSHHVSSERNITGIALSEAKKESLAECFTKKKNGNSLVDNKMNSSQLSKLNIDNTESKSQATDQISFKKVQDNIKIDRDNMVNKGYKASFDDRRKDYKPEENSRGRQGVCNVNTNTPAKNIGEQPFKEMKDSKLTAVKTNLHSEGNIRISSDRVEAINQGIKGKYTKISEISQMKEKSSTELRNFQTLPTNSLKLNMKNKPESYENNVNLVFKKTKNKNDVKKTILTKNTGLVNNVNVVSIKSGETMANKRFKPNSFGIKTKTFSALNISKSKKLLHITNDISHSKEFSNNPKSKYLQNLHEYVTENKNKIKKTLSNFMIDKKKHVTLQVKEEIRNWKNNDSLEKDINQTKSILMKSNFYATQKQERCNNSIKIQREEKLQSAISIPLNALRKGTDIPFHTGNKLLNNTNNTSHIELSKEEDTEPKLVLKNKYDKIHLKRVNPQKKVDKKKFQDLINKKKFHKLVVKLENMPELNKATNKNVKVREVQFEYEKVLQTNNGKNEQTINKKSASDAVYDQYSELVQFPLKISAEHKSKLKSTFYPSSIKKLPELLIDEITENGQIKINNSNEKKENYVNQMCKAGVKLNANEAKPITNITGNVKINQVKNSDLKGEEPSDKLLVKSTLLNSYSFQCVEKGNEHTATKGQRVFKKCQSTSQSQMKNFTSPLDEDYSLIIDWKPEENNHCLDQNLFLVGAANLQKTNSFSETTNVSDKKTNIENIHKDISYPAEVKPAGDPASSIYNPSTEFKVNDQLVFDKNNGLQIKLVPKSTTNVVDESPEYINQNMEKQNSKIGNTLQAQSEFCKMEDSDLLEPLTQTQNNSQSGQQNPSISTRSENVYEKHESDSTEPLLNLSESERVKNSKILQEILRMNKQFKYDEVSVQKAFKLPIENACKFSDTLDRQRPAKAVNDKYLERAELNENDGISIVAKEKWAKASNENAPQINSNNRKWNLELLCYLSTFGVKFSFLYNLFYKASSVDNQLFGKNTKSLDTTKNIERQILKKKSTTIFEYISDFWRDVTNHANIIRKYNKNSLRNAYSNPNLTATNELNEELGFMNITSKHHTQNDLAESNNAPKTYRKCTIPIDVTKKNEIIPLNSRCCLKTKSGKNSKNKNNILQAMHYPSIKLSITEPIEYRNKQTNDQINPTVNKSYQESTSKIIPAGISKSEINVHTLETMYQQYYDLQNRSKRKLVSIKPEHIKIGTRKEKSRNRHQPLSNKTSRKKTKIDNILIRDVSIEHGKSSHLPFDSNQIKNSHNNPEAFWHDASSEEKVFPHYGHSISDLLSYIKNKKTHEPRAR